MAEHDPSKKVVAGKHAANIKGAIEWIGEHPFATGLLAIFGIVGFIFSVYAFSIDRMESAGASEQLIKTQNSIDNVGNDVSEVRAAVLSNCNAPPCWSLRDFAKWETIGRPKDLIDAKLHPPERRRDGATYYDLDGCRVRVEYTDEAVSYFSASLIGYSEIEGENGPHEYKTFPCDLDINQFVRNVEYDWPATDNLTLLQLIEAMASPEHMKGNLPSLYIASACLDCGNYREPYLELFRPGPHASDFVNIHITTTFAPNPQQDPGGNAGDVMFDQFREAMRARIGPEAEFGIETQPLCDQDLAQPVAELLPIARVTELGMGRGARTWTNVLFCSWWEN